MYYTYLWLRHNGTPYYVGKGTGRRAYLKEERHLNPPSEQERIIVQDFESEQDAFAAEMFLIDFYGRVDLGTGCLRNLTAGGEGIHGGWWTGKKLSEEHKEKDRQALRGEKNPFYGRRHSAQTKAKISAANRGPHGPSGYKHTPEARAKLKAARNRRITSEETKRRMSESHKKRWKKLREQSCAGLAGS